MSASPHAIAEPRLGAEPTPRPRVLIAEDHALVREGLRRLLSADLEVIEAVADGRALLDAAIRLQPDLVLLDIAMPGLNGLEAARQLRERCPGARIVFVTAHLEPAYVREAFRAGASGYVVKHAAFDELLVAVREVLARRTYVSPTIDLEHDAPAGQPIALADPLTSRQREVLQLVAEGRTSRQIGVTLNISPKTAEFHKASLLRVLGLQSTAELTRYALEHGVIGR